MILDMRPLLGKVLEKLPHPKHPLSWMNDTVVIKCKRPLVVEVDSAALAAYVRFSRKQVVKTKLVTSKAAS
jgi:hypothetical protein